MKPFEVRYEGMDAKGMDAKGVASSTAGVGNRGMNSHCLYNYSPIYDFL